MEAPTIYIFHPETKELIGISQADASPMDDPGVWLYPANTTDTPPPELADGEVAYWNDQSWDVLTPSADTTSRILAAPADLFGGPTLKDIFDGN